MNKTVKNTNFIILYRPTGEIVFPDEYHGLFTDDLSTIPEGSILWKVFAWDAPEQLEGQEELIGEYKHNINDDGIEIVL